MALINGGATSEHLVGTSDPDIIRGFGGSDLIEGGDGDDILQGDGFGVLDVNGSFENYENGINTPNAIVTADVPGWTLLQGGNFELIRTQNKIAADGLLSLDMESTSGNLRIAQQIPDLVGGLTYALTFQYSRLDEGTNVGLEVIWNGEVVGTIADAEVTTDFETFSINVVEGTGDGTNTLTFRETGAIDGAGTIIDDVRFVGQAGGADTLLGGDGDDILAGGYGPDVYDGGPGFNVVQFGTGVTLDLADPSLNTGESVGDSYANINLFQGSGAIDVLRGDEGRNRLWGGSGADTLIGRGGDDDLRGQNGSDSLDGGSGSDELYGGSGTDTLRGGDGDDYLDGGLGADVLDGGLGFDRVDYRTAASAIKIELADATGLSNLGDATGDKYISVEEFDGSNFSDTILGSGIGDVLFGLGGNDLLDGRGGNDGLYGDQGNDTLLGGDGDDILIGGTGDDVLDGGAGDDTLIAGDDADRIIGGGGRDLMDGGAGDDTLEGGTGLDDYTGGAGADLLIWRSPAEGGVWGDRVFGFTSGEDKLGLDHGGFAGLVAGQVLVDGVTFIAAPGAQATGSGPVVLYDTTTGIISFDADGAGGAAAVWFAEMQGKPLVTASDFILL